MSAKIAASLAAAASVAAQEGFDYTLQLEAALDAIRIFNTLASMIDFDRLLAAMERSEAIGCFTDPTLWRQAIGGLQSQKRTIAAAAAFKAALAEQLADETGAK
jgi:hypothetical protein